MLLFITLLACSPDPAPDDVEAWALEYVTAICSWKGECYGWTSVNYTGCLTQTDPWPTDTACVLDVEWIENCRDVIAASGCSAEDMDAVMAACVDGAPAICP